MRTLLMALLATTFVAGCGESQADIEAKQRAEIIEGNKRVDAYNAEVARKRRASNAALDVPYPEK